MKWSDANKVVENLRGQTKLYLPSLSGRMGFSSSRIEHLLNGLARKMPEEECYLEVGVLEGRTLEAASRSNSNKHFFGIDDCKKYKIGPGRFGKNVIFKQARWEDILKNPLPFPVGVVFYDADHSRKCTASFMNSITKLLANEAVLVLDDWDRKTVRDGAFSSKGWRLLREMPEYTDGLTCPPNHFGYYFGISVWGFKR